LKVGGGVLNTCIIKSTVCKKMI